MLRATKVENISCEEQAKFIHERLQETEELMSKLASSFSIYIKKSSRLRDATDDIALILNDYAVNEKFSKSTKAKILQFSELLASLNDLRDAKIQQLQSSLLNHLYQYNTICRSAKTEVKCIFNNKEKEATKRKQFGKIKGLSCQNTQHIMEAETSLSSVPSNVSRTQRDLEEHALCFEKKKLKDVKSVLLDYVSLELTEYSKGVEILTQSFNELYNINITNDYKEFDETLKNNTVSMKLKSITNSPRVSKHERYLRHRSPVMNEEQ